MSDESVNDATLRQFLLGNVDDEDLKPIESRFMINSVFKETVLALELDLIEDYLEDSLTPNDKERFLTQYSDTPAQRRKLRIAKSIKEWAVREGHMIQNGTADLSFFGRPKAYLRLKPLFVIPIAASAMIAIVLGVIWLKSGRQPQNRQSPLEVHCRYTSFTFPNSQPVMFRRIFHIP